MGRNFSIGDNPGGTRAKLLFMAELTPLTYGDEVRVIDGEHKGRTGAIVGMNDPDLPSIFTIEFGDGSDAEVPLGFLEKLYEP
ncbi:MAG: KOW motif-containing protein [Terracidiphilus sp.]|jgi:hypothetical protein